MTIVANLSVVVDADISRFNSGMNTVSNRVTSVGQSMQTVGSSMTSMGANMAAVTLPIVGGLAAAVSMATDFNQSMSNVNAILQLGAEDASALNAEILEIGSHAVAGPQAVAEAYYDVVGGVSDAASRIPILNAAIATSEAGAADLTATTNVLIGAMNAYGASADDAAGFSDVLTATVAAGVGTMDEFAAAFPAVTGVAASMGIEFSQLGGMMALITTRGTSAAQASTQLGAVMTSMLRPSQEMTAALADIGYSSGQAAVDALGLQGTFQALADAGYTNFATLTGSVEGMRGAIALTSAGATDFLTNFASNIDGATAAAREIQLGDASAQFSLLQSSASGLAITLGQSLMLSLSGLATTLTPIVQGITDWATANPQLSGGLVAVVGGAALLGALMIPLGMIISGVGAVLTTVGAIAASAAFPFILIGLAIGGLIAFSGDLPLLGEAISGVVADVQQLMAGDVQGWVDLHVSLSNLAGVTLVAIADGVINLIGALTGQDLSTFTEQWGSIPGMLQASWDGIQVVLIAAGLGLENAGLQVQLTIQEFVSGLRDTILGATNGAIDIAPNIQMDIAATQAAMQANVDEAIAAANALLTPTEVTASADIIVVAGGVDVAEAGVVVGNTIGNTIVTSTINADVTVTASTDTSAAQASIDAAVASMTVDYSIQGNVTVTMNNTDINSRGGVGGPPVAAVDVPQGATGADISGEGLMYVHANEKLLNAADTEAYNNGARSGGGGGGGAPQNFYLTSYGTAPVEVMTMYRRAARNAAPG